MVEYSRSVEFLYIKEKPSSDQVHVLYAEGELVIAHVHIVGNQLHHEEDENAAVKGISGLLLGNIFGEAHFHIFPVRSFESESGRTLEHVEEPAEDVLHIVTWPWLSTVHGVINHYPLLVQVDLRKDIMKQS